MTTRLYNQKKHERAKAAHDSLKTLYWHMAKKEFLELGEDDWFNDEVDE